MKTKSKQLISAAAVSGLILAAGGAVFAHGGFGPGGTGPGWTGPGMHGGMMGGMGMMGGPGGMRGGMMGGPSGMHGFMGGPQSTGGDPITHTNEWLTNLKQTLGIATEQETVWNGYVEASQAKAKLMESHHKTMHGGTRASLDTETHLKMMQEGAQHMEQLATATRELYAALTKEQKTTADRWLGRHHFGPHHFGSVR